MADKDPTAAGAHRALGRADRRGARSGAGAGAAGAADPRSVRSGDAPRGLDPIASLERNDAYAFLDALDDLVITGPTGINVLDVMTVMVEG